MQQDSSNKVRGPSIRLSTVATTTRQTPKTDFGTVMRDGLIKAGNVAVEGLQVAAPFVPGSAIVSAAIAGANIAGNVSQPSAGPNTYGGGPASGFASSGMYLHGGGAVGGGAGGIGSSTHGLTAGGSSGGAGPGSVTGAGAIGGFNSTGNMTIPGQRPGLNTPVNQAPSNFSGNYGAGTTGGNVSGSGDAFNQMMSATRTMAEFQASFNLQYLQLQEKIQQDTRQFNLVSNIMKTKHDAAKNALNNVR